MKITETSKKKVEQIDGIVNDTCFNPVQVGVGLTKAHRYTKNQIGLMSYYNLLALAKDYIDGNYDGRDERACKLAFVAFDSDEDTINELYSMIDSI